MPCKIAPAPVPCSLSAKIAGAIAATLLILLPATALNAVSGLETVPAALALTVGVILLTREADAKQLTKWTALLCLAFTMLRPEGVLLFAIWVVLLLPAVGWRALARWARASSSRAR